MPEHRIVFGPKEWIGLVGAFIAVMTTVIGASVTHGRKLEQIERNTAASAANTDDIIGLREQLHSIDRRLVAIEAHLRIHVEEVE